jgi:two-component system, OmpR family, sensor kinase
MNASFGDRLKIAERLTPLRRSSARISTWLDKQTAFRHRIPIRARIALFGAAVVAVAVIVFGVAVYYLVQGNLIQQQDANLRQRGDQVWQFVERGGRFARGFPPVDLSTSSEPFVQIFSAQQASGFSSGTVGNIDPQWPSSTFDGVPSDHGITKQIQPVNGPPVRAYIRALVGPDLTPAGYMIVGQAAFAVEDQLAGLRLFLISGALLSLLGAAAASWLVAGRALRPLDEMATTAEDIGRTQDLSRRLPDSGTHDEVGRLQHSFNQMLRQLEDAYQRLRSALIAQRRFVADASHELRTPLTTIRGNIGLLLKREDITSEDRVAALHDIAGESERMSRMVQDLLTLARADAGYHLEKAPIDLRPIVQDVSRQAQTLQPTRRIELLDGVPATVQGNADAIKQLLWILIDNAFKHTREDGHIQLQLLRNSQSAALTISDDGPGIPAGDLERIFERFYQSDTSRSGEGTGLGLAIARWIAREHGGRVYAANNPRGGAAFTVELPIGTPQTLASH